MPVDAEAKVDTKKFKEAMDRFGPQFYTALRRRVGLYLKDWVRKEIKNKRFRGRPYLQTRSGAFVRTFDSKHFGANIKSLRFVTGVVHGNVPYARIHEEGGVIKPVRAKWLTIPLAPAKTPAGVARFSAKEAIREGGFFVRTMGSLFIARETDAAVEFLFHLVKRVKIPARLGFHKAFRDQIPALVRQFNLASADALKEGKRRA